MPRGKSKTIDEYRAKRDFGKTPEPAPGEPPSRSGAEAAFVVHRHEARRLHYDLRLEMDGVLKSWAVPRGFVYDPTVKHLAVHTEDHPMEYEHFEGVIPKDSYGAGTMTIWDRGRYRLAKEGEGAQKVSDGKLEIVLYGKKLRGEWHLVRTNKEKDEWLIFKGRDRYARAEGETAPTFDLSAATETSFPDDAKPMEPGEIASPFSDPSWIYEMKFRGLRLMALVHGETKRWVTPDGKDLTDRLPMLTRDLEELRAESVLLDGVLVALDEKRRPSPEKLEHLLASGDGRELYYYTFDILYYEEWDLRNLPLLDRKAVLASVVPRLNHLLYVDHVQGRGLDLWEMTSAAGLAGVIAKHPSAPYVAGSSAEWRDIPAQPAEDSRSRDVLEALRQTAPPSVRSRIKFSNLDKVFWPDEGYTKGELISFYEQVADLLVPYLHERPIHMLRYPDGIQGKLFYQKDAPDHVPDWVETEAIESGTRGEPIRYIICNDRETLLYMINLGSIDLHPWLSLRTSQETPDWAVLDLDPNDCPFSYAVRVARALGKLLRGIGLRPYLKTSGKKGIHIYIPLLENAYTYDHVVQFCEGVARFVANEHKDIATVDRVVSRRGKRIYIDFLQNRRGQTIVPPYVARPVPGASVSAPLDWDELDSELHPTLFTIKTMPARLSRLGDLFRGTLSDRQDLLPAIDALRKNYLNL